jgi:phosphohistidine phosphatase
VRIHLLRHGIAIDRADPACPTDPARFLTEKGRARTLATCRGWAAVGGTVDLLCVSPYVRAQQTADIAVEALSLHGCERVTLDALVPFGEPDEVVKALRVRTFSAALLVGHAPNLDRVIAFLVGADDPVTSLKKSGIATVELHTVAHAGGTLAAVYPSSVLRRLA